MQALLNGESSAHLSPLSGPGARALGCINLVWIAKLFKPTQIVKLHLADLKEAAGLIALRYDATRKTVGSTGMRVRRKSRPAARSRSKRSVELARARCHADFLGTFHLFAGYSIVPALRAQLQCERTLPLELTWLPDQGSNLGPAD